MKSHWERRWDRFLLAVLVTFAALESAALITDGAAATLTAHVRRRAGLEPRRPHGPLGRLLIVAFFAWATAHLGWGVLGIGSGRRESARGVSTAQTR